MSSYRKYPRKSAFLRCAGLVLGALPLMFGASATQAQPSILAPLQSTLQSGLDHTPLQQPLGESLLGLAGSELSGLDDVGLAALVNKGLLPLETALEQLPAAEQLWLSMPLGDDVQSQQRMAQEASLLIAQLRHWQSVPATQQGVFDLGIGTERARPEGAMDPVVSIARQARLIASRLFTAAHDSRQHLPKGLDSLLSYTQDRLRQFQDEQALAGDPLFALMGQLTQDMQSIDRAEPSQWAGAASSLHQVAVRLENMASVQDSQSMQSVLKRLRSKLPMTETGRAWRYEVDRALALLEQQGWVDMATMNSLLADWEMLAEAH